MPRHRSVSVSGLYRSHPYAKFQGVSLTGSHLTQFATIAVLVGSLASGRKAAVLSSSHYKNTNQPPTDSDTPTYSRAQGLHMSTSPPRTLEEGPGHDALLKGSVEESETQPDGNEDDRGSPENSSDEGYVCDEPEDVNNDGGDEESSGEDDDEYHEPRRSKRLAAGRQPGAKPRGQHGRAFCLGCGRTHFDRPHDKARHILSHNRVPSERPIKCSHEDCFWTFNQDSNRVSHVRTVHASMAHRCDGQLLDGESWRPCLFTCNTARNLTRHKNMNH